MGNNRQALAIGWWQADASADLMRPGAWSNTVPATDIDPTDQELLLRIIAQDAVRASMATPAGSVVLGGLVRVDRCIAFGAKNSEESILVWAASTDAEDLHALLLYWSMVTAEPELYDAASVMVELSPRLADISEADQLSIDFGPVAVPKPANAPMRVALYKPNRKDCLLSCYGIAQFMLGQCNESPRRPYALVDNLCTIGGALIDVAGLRSPVATTLEGWQIINRTMAPPAFTEPDQKSHQPHSEAQDQVQTATSAEDTAGETSALTAWSRPADIHELKGSPRHDSIAGFCRAVGDALIEPSGRDLDQELGAMEVAAFEEPLRLSRNCFSDAMPAWLSEQAMGPMIRAVLIARNPTLVLKDKRQLADWLKSLTRLELHEHAACLAVAAQAAYDSCALDAHKGAVARQPLQNMVQRAASRAIDASLKMPTVTKDSTWTREPVRRGLVEAFDRLAEVQIGIDQSRQLCAQALLRIALDRPTPDVVLRAIHRALDKNSKRIDALVGRGLISPAMTQLALAAIAERNRCDLAQAQDILSARFPSLSPPEDNSVATSFRTLNFTPADHRNKKGAAILDGCDERQQS